MMQVERDAWRVEAGATCMEPCSRLIFVTTEFGCGRDFL